ncbi:helix-turn-helix domain-containing protein [Halovivax cerinus]|uniref:Helix-turn-helix domain-containing protein n=1 Tax=Halovivax cerinus TaxID=1487865 RepID=A0ABD5NQW0_9EURY|nr:helix-turn-helix domain-containing protein [Halovivax cerinus]
MLEYVDATAAKILLSIRPGDSIRRIAQKVDGSYSWVYDWIERLESAEFVRRDDGVYVENYAVRERCYDLVATISRSTAPGRDEAYLVPHFSGLPFAYTKIDAVYVWTNGGYQIARGPDDYPIFVRVDERDVGRWTAFFDEFGIPSTIETRPDPAEFDASISYVLFPHSDDWTREWVDGYPVVPLAETVDHMLDYRVNYEPALEQLAEAYDLDVDASHEDPCLRP